ncbi:MAG: RNA polymerase sigma factor [Firmicutes bacterium]|nr:RNA polymerase sigma factor [Bacillota bacterium]
MDDLQIIEGFFNRSEDAISSALDKYGRYCGAVAGNILSDGLDVEECVNDCMLRAWNSIPPARPASLKAYLGKITRNLALDKAAAASAQKRGGGEYTLALDELSEIVSGGTEPEKAMENGEISKAIDRFLDGLDETRRKVFVRRYWYLDPVSEIADRFGLNESNVKTMLFRLRKDLAGHLKKEGIEI